MAVNDNLSIVPTALDFTFYNRYLERKFDTESQKVTFLREKLDVIKDKYDYIFLDVPPTISLPNETAFFACDQIVIVLQTQERSLNGAEILLSYLQKTIVDEFHSKMDVMGILPVLTKGDSRVDKEILKAASE